MHKTFSPFSHGLLDYATVLATALAPRLFRFPPPAARLSHALSAAYLGLSAMTDYPLALKRLVPFRTHGQIEFASGFALPLLPWIVGFAQHRAARNFLAALSVITFAVWSLTDWEAETKNRG
jgi:hypothetical protein